MYQREKRDKRREKEVVECAKSNWYWQDLGIIWLWRLSTTNHHHIRWVWMLWWNPHARRLRYCEPRKGLIWQNCCRREDQIRLVSDQSSENDYSLGAILWEDQSVTITNCHHKCWQIPRLNWSNKIQVQEQDAQPRGIGQPQKGRRSRKSKTAQWLDHLVQGT